MSIVTIKFNQVLFHLLETTRKMIAALSILFLVAGGKSKFSELDFHSLLQHRLSSTSVSAVEMAVAVVDS